MNYYLLPLIHQLADFPLDSGVTTAPADPAMQGGHARVRDPCANLPIFFTTAVGYASLCIWTGATRVHVATVVSLGFRVLVGS